MNSRLLEGHRHSSIFEAMPTCEVVTAIRDGQLTGQTASWGKFHDIHSCIAGLGDIEIFLPTL